MVQRDRQLDHAEARAEMAPGDGDGVDGLLAEIVGELLELRKRQVPHVGGDAHLIEQRGIGHDGSRRFGSAMLMSVGRAVQSPH